MPRNYKPRATQPVAVRFWRNVDKTVDCWLWTAFIHESGAGQFRSSASKIEKAHRFSYKLTYGPIPSDKVVAHTCKNLHCVRPEHLVLSSSQRFHQRELEPRPLKSGKQGFVYVMLNNRNGYYKIGFSTKPAIRERTLQAEDPDVEMVGFFPATTKEELTLHKQFAQKRIRGEWFSLSKEEATSIIQ